MSDSRADISDDPCPILSVRLFGPFSVRRDGEPLEVSGSKPRALLAVLAAGAGRPHQRDQLATMFWSHTGDRARHNLRQALSTLRTSIGDDDGELVVTEGSSLVIPPEHVDVDVARFRQLAASEELDELEQAAKLYDEFVPDLVVGEDPYDEWVAEERRRLREHAVDAVSRLARSALERDEAARAVDALRRLLDVEPAFEEGHRLIMECLAKTGRRSEALRQYETCVEALDRYLDTRPGPQTVGVYERLRDDTAAASTRPTRTAPLPLPDEPSVAVVPFRNLSGDPEQRYFSDGMAEDLTVALSQFGSLFVIARQSAFRYRDGRTDPREIGRDLGVHYIVDGSVRRSGDRVRVGAQLIDAASGEQVWGDRFDRELEDIFAVQDELTETIVATLVGRVESHRLERARRAPTDSLAAYDLLLHGKHHHHRYSHDDNLEAQRLIGRAIELDPDYAAAHAWMACVLAQCNTFAPDSALFDRAYEHVTTAVRLDDGESECHRVLAAYYLMQRKFDEATYHQERALQLNPNDDRIVCQEGEVLTYFGRPADGVEWIERALRLNPYHPGSFHGMLGHALFDAGRPSAALAALRRVPQKRTMFIAITVACLQALGRPEELRRQLDRLRESAPDFDPVRFVRRLPYRDRDDARSLKQALESACAS